MTESAKFYNTYELACNLFLRAIHFIYFPSFGMNKNDKSDFLAENSEIFKQIILRFCLKGTVWFDFDTYVLSQSNWMYFSLKFKYPD